MPVKTKPSGPLNAKVLIVGEAPGAEEEVQGVPFVGSSGIELTRMLHEAGFVREECFLTNVCKYRPPMNDISAFFIDSKQTKPNELILEGVKELKDEISAVKPQLILALGNTPLWALTGQRGITKWRGSMLSYTGENPTISSSLMPTFHPALIMREWGYRAIAVHDLKRARQCLSNGGWPARSVRFSVRPSFSDTMDVLGVHLAKAKQVPIELASDIETRAGHIACHGLAWSDSEAISIPFMCVERPQGYWTVDEEISIWERQRELMTHPNVSIIGQNYLFDAQYFARRWGYLPRLRHDTMWMQHVAFAGLPKGLDFLSSMYRRYHRYWKDEGKNWDKNVPEEQLWSYNCEDAIATWEIRHTLETVLRSLPNQWDLYLWQMGLWQPIIEMILRGVRIDEPRRSKVASELISAVQDRQQGIEYILGHPFNVNSSKQMKALFYDRLQCKVIRNRKTKQPTCDEDALRLFGEREPLLRCLTERIADIRSLGNLLSGILEAQRDSDGRMRSAFSPTKETYRWGSSKNAFGGGTNMQNWTKGDEDKKPEDIVGYPVPNSRKLIIPDLDYDIASIDLTGADAQTVAWEADDKDLKRVFRENKIKIHAHNAKVMFPDKALTGYEQPYYDLTRTGVHLINYLGGVETLANAMGVSSWAAQRFITTWFNAHPNILNWHNRIEAQLQRTRTVTNVFGYRRFFFERIEGILPEAIAWIGQSMTACICNRALKRMANDQFLKAIGLEILLQVHDEIVFQYPTRHRHTILQHLHPLIHVAAPYPEPLIIPWGLKLSTTSWGECEKYDWPGYFDQAEAELRRAQAA
jgi:uracil-DNA glycosylase family 4